MSAIDPGANKPTVYTPVQFHSPAAFVDTNALLQKAIMKLPSAIRSGIVLRCDELAHLLGTEEAIENTFAQLLEMIVAEKESFRKLYLHITCTKGEKSGTATGNSTRRFMIQFHANVTLRAEWMQEAQQQMSRISSHLLPYGGSLHVNQLKNSGCMFCITLPGK